MIVVDTSVLIEALGAGGSMRKPFRQAIESGLRMVLTSVVLYEWLRGPRLPEELAVQEAILPSDDALSFGPNEAQIAADLYRAVSRPRGRELDLAIAACTIAWDGVLWTLNPADFMDIPGLRLHS